MIAYFIFRVDFFLAILSRMRYQRVEFNCQTSRPLRCWRRVIICCNLSYVPSHSIIQQCSLKHPKLARRTKIDAEPRQMIFAANLKDSAAPPTSSIGLADHEISYLELLWHLCAKKKKKRFFHTTADGGHFIDQNDLLGEEWRFLARNAFLIQILDYRNQLCVSKLVQWLLGYACSKFVALVPRCVALVPHYTDRGYISSIRVVLCGTSATALFFLWH